MGVKELLFYVNQARKINKRFKGKHIALVGDTVVASGTEPKTVWEKAAKKSRGKRPVLAYVPREETLVLIID